MILAGPGSSPAAVRSGTAGAPPAISAVVPALNEAESLPELHRQLVAALEAGGRSWEIVYVDDGSRDATERVLEQLAGTDPRVVAIVLRRNFGKSAALATGFRQARGELILTLDSDLQDDPAELPRLIAALEGGLDLVSGWKQSRRDPVSKTIPSKLFNAVTSAVAGVKLHDFNCGLKLYRREVVEAIEVYGELHRFMPALAHWRGFRVGEIPVNHRPRLHGRSKFGPARFVNGFLDLMAAAFISTSALKPLHVFGRMGILFLIGGMLPMGLFVVQWFQGVPLRVRPLMLLGVGMVIVGLLFILMGLLGEMIAHMGARAEYPVRRRYGRDDREPLA